MRGLNCGRRSRSGRVSGNPQHIASSSATCHAVYHHAFLTSILFVFRGFLPPVTLCFAESDGGRRRWEAPPTPAMPRSSPSPPARSWIAQACAGMRRSPPYPSGRRGYCWLSVGRSPTPPARSRRRPLLRSGLNPPRFLSFMVGACVLQCGPE